MKVVRILAWTVGMVALAVISVAAVLALIGLAFWWPEVGIPLLIVAPCCVVAAVGAVNITDGGREWWP